MAFLLCFILAINGLFNEKIKVMKTTIISLAAILFMSVIAYSAPKSNLLNSNANLNPNSSVKVTVADTTQVPTNEFKEVTVNQLNDKVKSAVNALAEEYMVDKIYYNEATKITKVLVTSKKDQVKSEFMFNEEGQKVV